MRKVLALATVCTVTAMGLAPVTAQAQWGTIKGQVTVTGDFAPLKALVAKGDAGAKDADVCAAAGVPDETVVVDPESKGLANVVVWLAKKPAKIHPDLAKSKNPEVTFDQKGCQFIPHVLLVRTDQKVRVLSNDGVAHNTHTYPLKNKQENFIVAPNDRAGVAVPSVSLEERLPAWWVILDHPYAAVTNAKGEFEIADLPVGEHEFRVWQEKAGYLEKTYKVTVKAGENKLTPIKVQAATLK
jgi:hypothetical protein